MDNTFGLLMPLALINRCGPTPYRPAIVPRDSQGCTTCHSVLARTVGWGGGGSGVGVTGGDPGNGVGGRSRVRRSGVGSGEGATVGPAAQPIHGSIIFHPGCAGSMEVQPEARDATAIDAATA